MKNLFLLRGLPGSGKSTYIKAMELEPYTLSSDKLREMFAGLEYNIEGNLCISGKRDKHVWETLFVMLESRMQRGLTTIIDSTNIKEKSIGKYKKLADKYGYKVYIVDFTFVSVETCVKRNKSRGYKKVPETVIYRMANNLEIAKIPDWAEVISPDNFISLIHSEDCEIAADKYSKITFIGDVHGCYTTLKRVFNKGIDEKTLYVFTGDYIDRGPQSVKTMLWLSNLAKKKNFIFLEGNHERWLRNWLNNDIDLIRSDEFINNTMPQFEKYFRNNFNEKRKEELKDLRNFITSLKELVLIKLSNESSYRYIFACHGGVPYINPVTGLMSSEDIIRGVGKYQDCVTVDNEFNNKLENQIYQVHGHRNFYNSPIQVNNSVFNLEGSVERGGYLRTVTFNLEDGKVISIESKEFKNEEELF